MSSPDPITQLIAHLKSDAPFLQDGHHEVFLARAPGRLDVMGGLSEYAGSLVCQMPLEAATAVALQRRDDRRLVLKNYNPGDPGQESHDPVTLSLDDFYGTASLLPIDTQQKLFAGKQWAAHIAGAYPTLAKHKKLTRRSHGANIACFSNIPFQAGVASSAALQCATLWALTAAYHLILDPLEIALLAQKIENQLVGTMAGVMEPAVSVLGRKDQLLLLQCQPHEHRGYVALPPGLMLAGFQFGRKDAAAAYRATRVSAFMAQAIITKFYADTGVKKDPTAGYLANIRADHFHRYFAPMLPETILGDAFLKEYGAIPDRLTSVDPAASYFPRTAAEFHVNENARAQRFIELLRSLADPTPPTTTTPSPEVRRQIAAEAGTLMLESHGACSRQAGLTSQRGDLLVELVMRLGPERGFYGARLAGGEGGGGVTVLLEESARGSLSEIAAEYAGKTGRQVQLLTGSSAGAAEAAPLRMTVAELGGAN